MTVYVNAEGWRVEANRTTEGVDFHQEGGGCVYSMPTAQFDSLFKSAPAQVWRRGTVTAEFLGEGVSLPCWSDGSRWNGFGQPHFEREVVDHLTQLSADPGLPPIGWEGDKVAGDEDGAVAPFILPNGTMVWGVGAGYWCWDAVEHEDLKGWTRADDALPPDETPVLILHRGQVRIGELRWEHPSHEETFQAVRFWDDPNDDGQDWQWYDVVAWRPIPDLPVGLPESLTPEK